MTSPRLRWKAPDGRDQEFLISSAEIVIGRKGDADLVLSNQHVSRRHAKLVKVPDGHELVDLGSTYGTFVNDERVSRATLRHGDRVLFGKGEMEFRYLTGDAEARQELETTRIVQKSFNDLGRVLPSTASDLEKILCVLDFQYHWNQVFTPENGLSQILESALKISGAERAFIMVKKDDAFGFAAGMSGNGRKLREADFHTSQSIVREVVAHTRPVFMQEGIEANFAAQASIVGMNLRAIACLPLLGIPTGSDHTEILGILYLDSTKAMHSLSGLDEKILGKLAVEAGNVLERVEMIKSIDQRKAMERDLALAEDTQRSLLPRHIPQLENFRLHAICKPTRYVGGDFYDFHVNASGGLVAALADISGKGVAASVLSSMLLGCLQLLLQDGGSPQAVLNRLNKFLIEKSSGKFATMFLFSIDMLGKGHFISAGHNPAFVHRASSGTIDDLPSNNLILGVFDFVSYEVSPVELHPGDIMLVYSDGLTEAENVAGQMFGEERVKEIMMREAAFGTERLQNALLAAVSQFSSGREQTDDITLMITQRS